VNRWQAATFRRLVVLAGSVYLASLFAPVGAVCYLAFGLAFFTAARLIDEGALRSQELRLVWGSYAGMAAAAVALRLDRLEARSDQPPRP
jgi:hypothetical protein